MVSYKDPEKRRAYQNSYNAIHREDHRAYYAAYYIAHKEETAAHNAAYYAAHKEELAKYAANYRAEHLDERRAYESSYRVANADKINVRGRIYRADHRAERTAKKAQRRALKIVGTAGDPTAIKAIYRRAREAKNVKCYLCGGLIPMDERHVDHVIPLSKGGKHAASNLAIACAKCNLSKGDKWPHEIGVLL